MITSTANPKIKWVRQLQAHSRERREAGAFVVEGVRLVEEALAAGWEAQLVLYTDDLSERGRRVVEAFALRGAPLELVSPEVLHAASDTETPQGLLAVLSQRLLPLPAAPDLVFIPDQVRDPGNLGTMLRTALAAGVGASLSARPTSSPRCCAGMSATSACRSTPWIGTSSPLTWRRFRYSSPPWMKAWSAPRRTFALPWL
jgi:TrmH family RNA methyltransferase